MDSRSATDGPLAGPGVLECEESPEFEDGIIEVVVVMDDDGPAYSGPGPGPGLGPGADKLELETGVPPPSTELE